MTFAAFFDFAVLIFLKTARAESDAVIKLHSRTDLRRFANDHAGPMIDEKVRTDFCARMNVDPGPAVRPLGHDSRNERQIHFIKNMRHSLDRDRFERRVSKNDFFVASRRGIAFKCRIDVGPKEATNLWQFGEEIGQEFIGLRFGRFVRRNFSQTAADFSF